MKKIIVSAAVAALALTTTASALEDIKVNGQAKLWYETNNGGTNDMFNKKASSGEFAMKLGVTGKQGNVGFGASIYQTSTMGLEGLLVNSTRSETAHSATYGQDADMYVGEAYFTAPIAGATLKMGMQELDTPLLYSERWNVTPITYNAAVGIIPATENLTVVAAYVGQSSNGGTRVADYAGFVDGSNPTPTATNGWASSGTPANQINDHGAFALAGLYKTDALAVNAWYYSLPTMAMALWVDASIKAGPANIKAYLGHMMEDEDLDANDDDSTTAVALSAGMAVSGINLFGAFSTVTEDGALAVANVGTGFKKTKLPTAAVYLDGLAVAQPGATSIKLKAAGKVAGTGLAAQLVSCSNDSGVLGGGDSAMELDVIATAKLGDFNIKGILMHRDFDTKDAQQHIRLITSINF